MNSFELENKISYANFIVTNNGCGILTCTKNTLFNGFDCPIRSEGDLCGAKTEIVARAKEFIASNSEVFPTKCADNKEHFDSYGQQSRLSEILAERKENYGSFESHSLISQRLKAVIASGRDKGKPFEADVAEALEMICHKIARIVNGREDYVDSWDDIAGYATLVANRIIKEQQK